MNITAKQMFGSEISGHTAAAIGAFDGIHLGHRHILGETIAYAKAHHLTSAAILFDPLPSQFFGRLGENERILLQSEQETMLHAMDIDRVIFLPFSESVAGLTPAEFLEGMQSVLHCERLFMGADFSLGKGRSGNTTVLSELGKQFGFDTKILEKDTMDGDIISSTRIRALLHEGRVSDANRLLGYPFFFSGTIIHGQSRGRTLGFPTINVKIPEGKLTLPNGVYAVYNYLDGQRFASVTNIGVRPTFGLESLGIFVESYLLDVSGNFYGEKSRLEFVEMLRKEIRFSSADQLKDQINKDIQKARQILR